MATFGFVVCSHAGRRYACPAYCWKKLRNRHIANAKFRRQHSVGSYVLDFYCAEHKLCIEVDGSQHADQVDYDQQRTNWQVAHHGIRVLRFWNNQVLLESESNGSNLQGVDLPESALTPAPLPQGEGVKHGTETQTETACLQYTPAH